jgi:hypothetical protein
LPDELDEGLFVVHREVSGEVFHGSRFVGV